MAPLSFSRLRLSSRSSNGKTPATAGGCRSSRSSSNDRSGRDAQNSADGAEEEKEDVAAAAHVAGSQHSADPTPSRAPASATPAADNPRSPTAVTPPPPLSLCATAGAAANTSSRDSSGPLPNPHRQRDSLESSLRPNAPQCANQQQPQQQAQRRRPPVQQREGESTQQCRQEDHLEQYRQYHQQQQRQPQQQHKSKHQKQQPQQQDLIFPPSHAVRATASDFTTTAEAAQPRRLRAAPAAASSRTTLAGADVRNPLVPLKASTFGARAASSSPSKKSRLAAAARALLSPQAQSPQQQQPAEGRGNGNRGKSSLIEQLLFRKKDKRQHTCDADKPAADLLEDRSGSRDNGNQPCSEMAEPARQAESEEAAVAASADPALSVTITSDFVTPRSEETPNGEEEAAEEEKVVEGEEVAALPARTVKGAPPAATAGAERRLFSTANKSSHSDEPSADENQPRPTTKQHQVKNELALQRQTEDGCCTSESSWLLIEEVKEDGTACDSCAARAAPVGEASGTFARKKEAAPAPVEDSAAVAEEDDEEEKAKDETAAPNEEAVLPNERSGAAAEEEEEEEEDTAVAGQCETDDMKVSAVFHNDEAAPGAALCAAAATPRHDEGAGEAMAAGGAAAAHHIMEEAGGYPSEGAVSRAAPSERMPACSQPGPQLLGDACCSCSSGSKERHKDSCSSSRDSSSCSSERYSHLSDSSVYVYDSSDEPCCEEGGEKKQADDVAAAASGNGAGLIQQESRLWETHDEQQQRLQQQSLRALRQQERQRKKPEQKQQQQDVKEKPQQPHRHPKQQQRSERRGQQQKQRRQSLGQKQHQRRHRSAEEELLRDTSEGMPNSSAAHAAAASSRPLYWRDRSRSSGSSRKRCSSRDSSRNRSSRGSSRNRSSSNVHKDARVSASHGNSLFKTSEPHPTEPHDDGDEKAASVFGSAATAAGLAAAGSDAAAGLDVVPAAGPSPAAAAAAPDMADGALGCRPSASKESTKETQQKKEKPQLLRLSLFALPLSHGSCSLQSSRSHAAGTGVLQGQQRLGLPETGLSTAAPRPSVPRPTAAESATRTARIEGAAVLANAAALQDTVSEATGATPGAESTQQQHLADTGMCVFVREVRASHRASTDPLLLNSSQLACEENSCGGTGGEERVRRQQPCWNGFRCNGCSSTPQSLCCSARKNSCSTRSGCSSTSSGSARCSAGPSTKGATSSSRSTGSSCRTDSGSTLGSDTGSLHCSSSEREGRASSEDCSSDGSVQGLSSGSIRSRKPSVETDDTPDGTLCSAPVGRRSSHGSHNDGEGSTSNTPTCLSQVNSASSLPSCNGLSKCPAAVAASELRGKEGVVQTNTRQRVSHPQQHHRQGGEHLPQPPFHHDDQNQWHQRQQQQTQQQHTQQQQTQQQQIQQQQMQQQQTEQQKPSSGCPPVRPKSVVCSASSGSAVLPIASPRTRPRGILPTPRELQQQPLSETPAAAAAAAAKAAARQRHLPVTATGALPPNAISSGSECARDGPKEEAQGGGRRAAARAGRRRTSLAGGSAAATPVTTEAFAACSLEELEREPAVTEKRGAAATAAAGAAYALWNTSPDEEAAEPPRTSAAADKPSPTNRHQEEQKAGSCRLNTRRATEQPRSKRGAAAAAVTAAGRSRMKAATAVAAAAAAEENSVASSSTCRRPTDSGVRKGKMIVKEPESLSADDTSRESYCCALDFVVHADGNANAARRRDTRALQRLPAAAAAGTTAAARRRAVPASRGVAPAAARGVAGERAAPRGGGEGRESAAAAAGRRGKAVADLEGEERRASLPRTLLALPRKKATGGGSRETSVARVTPAAAPTWPPRRARAEPAAASGVLMGRNVATGEDPWSSEFACGVSLRWQQDLGEERRRSRQDGPQGDGEWTIRRSNKEAGAGGGVGERAAEANQEENSFYRLKQGKKEQKNAQEESLDQEKKATLRFLASGEAAADKEERNAGAGIWQRSEEKEEEVGGTEDEEQFLCQEAENESARKEEEEFLEQTEEQDQCSDSGKASGDASSVVVYETDDDAADSSRSAESFGSNSEDSAGERSRRCSNSSKAYASSSRRSSDSALCSSCCPKCPSHGRRTSDSNSLAATAAAAAAACMESAPPSSFVASLSATAADFPDESPSTERLHVAAAAAVEAEAASQKEKTADDSAAATAGEVHTGAPTTAAVAAVEEEEEEEEEQHPIEGINEEERSEASTAEAEIGGEPEERAAASAGRHELSTGKTDDEAKESSLPAAPAAPEAWKTDAPVVIAAAGAAAAGASPRVANGEKASSRINATHEGAAAAPTATGIEDKDTRRLLAEQTVGTVWPDRTGWGHAGQVGCSVSAAAPGDAATMVDPSSLLAVAAAAPNAGCDVAGTAETPSASASATFVARSCKVTAGWRLGCSSNKATSAPTKTTATHALPPARVVAEEAAAAEVAHEQGQDEMCVAASLTKSPGHRITPAAAAAEEKEEREEKASDTARATRVMTATATAAVSQSAARETEGPVPRERSKCSQCGLHLPLDELADHLLAHALSESPRAAAAAGVLDCQEFQQQQQEQLQELGQQVYRWPDPPWLQRHQSCNGTFERSAQTKHSFWPPFLTLQAQQGNRYAEEVAVPPQQQHVTDDLLHEEEDPQQHRTSLPSTAYQPQLSTGAAAVDPVACFARSAVEPVDVALPKYHTAKGAGGPAAAAEGESSQFQALPRGPWPSGSQGSSSKEDACAAGGDTPATAAETAVTPATTRATRSVKKQQQQVVLHVASEEKVPGAPVDGGKEAGDEEVKEEKNEKEEEGQRPKETQAALLGHGEAGCTRAATTAEATSAAGAGAAAAVAKVPGTMVAASAPAAGHGSADEQRQNEAGEAKMLPKWKGWASCGKNTRGRRAEFEQDGAGGAAASRMVLRSRSAPERGGEASYVEVAASASNCFASINLRNRGTAVGVLAEDNTAIKREAQGPAESGPRAAVDVEAPEDLPAASAAAEKAAAAVGAAPGAGPEAKPAEATSFLGERENAIKKDSEAPHEGEEAGAPRTTADLRRTAGEETAATAEENSGVCWEPSGCRHSADASRRKTACDRNKSAEQQRADEGKAGPSSDTAAELAGGGCSTVLEREAQTLRRCSSPSCDATAATAGSSFREFSSPCLSSSSCSRAIDSGSSGTQPRISRSRKPGSSSGEMTYRDGATFASSTSVNAKPEEGRRGSRSSSSSVHSSGNDGQGRSRLPSRSSSAGGRRKSRNSSVGSSSSNSRSSSSSHRSSAPRRRPWGSVLISQEPTSGRVQQQKDGGSCMQQLLCQTDPAEAETCDTHSCAVAERSVPEEDLQTNMTRSSRSASDGSCSDSGPRHGRGGEQSSDRRRPPQSRLRRESERRGPNLSPSSFPCSSREKDRPQTCRCSPRVGSSSADRYAVQRCRCSAGTACCGCSASAGDAAAALGGRRQHIAHEEPHRRSSSGKHGSSCSNGTNKSSRPCSGDQHTSSGSQNPHGNSGNTADCPSSRQEGIPARTSSNTEGSREAKTSGQGLPHRRGSSSSDSCRSSEHTSDSNKNTSSLDDSRSEASVGSGCRTHARASNRNTLGEREKRNSRRRRSVRQLRQKQRQLSGDLQRHQDDQAKDTKRESQQQGREGEGTALVSPTARTCSAEDCGSTAGCSSGMPPLRRRLRAPAYQQQEHSEGTPPQKRQAAAQQPPAQQQQPSAQQQQPSTQQQQGSLEAQQRPEQHLTPAASDRLMLRTELAVSSSRDNSTEGRSSRCASSRSSVSGETVGINIACEAASGTNRTSITTPGQRWVESRSSNSPPAPEETTTCGAEASIRISAASMRGASSSAAAPPSGMSLAHMYSDDPSAALTSSADRRLAAAAFFGPTEGAAAAEGATAADAWDETVAVPAVGSVAWTVGAAAAGSNPKAAAAAAALKKGSRRGSETAGQTQSNLVRSRVGEQPKLPPFRRRRLAYFAAEQASTETGEQTAAAVQQRSAETARERHQPLDAASQEQRAADQQAPVEQQAAAVPTGTGEQQQQHPGAEMHRFAAADGALHGPQTQAATGVGASAGCLTSRNSKPSSKTPRPIGLLPCLAAAAAHRAAAANAASSSSAANSARETGGRHVRSTRAAAKAAATQKGGESRKSSSSPVSSNSRLSSNGGFSSSSSTSSRQQSGGSKPHQSTRGSAGLNLRRRGAMQEEGSGNQLHAAHPRTSPAAAPDAAGRGSGAATARFHRYHLQLRTAGLIPGRGADGPAAASTRAPPPATARLQQSDPPLRLTSQGLRRYMSYSRQQQLQQEQRRAKCAAAAMARAARAAAAAETASSGAPADEPPTLGDATVVLPEAARDARAAAPRPTTAAGRGPAGARRRSAEVAATGRAGTRFERGFPTCCASAAVDLTADGTGGSGQPAAGAAAAAVEAEPGEAASDAEESAAEDAFLVETEALVVPVSHRLLASGPTALNLRQQEQQQQQERRERIGERHPEQLEQQHLLERVCSDGPHEAGRSPRFHHGVAPAASAFTEASVDRQRFAAAQEETIYDEGEVRSISSGSGSRVSPGANELDSVEEELPLEPGAAPSATAEDSLAQTERTPAIAAGRAQHDTAAAGAATAAEAPASATATAAPAASPRLLEGGNRTSRGGNSPGVHCVPPLHLASLRAGPAGLPTASSRGRDVSSAGSSPGVAEVPAAAAEPCGRRKGEGGHSLAAKERETGTSTTATAVEAEEEGKHKAVSSEEETSTVVSRGGANSSRTAASVASPPATASPLSIRTSRLRPCRYPSSSPPPSSTEKSAPHPPSSNTLRNASSSSSAPPRPPAASPGGTASRLHSGHSSSTAVSSAAAGSSRQRSTAKQDAGFAASSTRRTQAVAGSAGTSTESTATPTAAAGSASRQTSSLTSAAAASSSTTASLVSRQTSRGSVGASSATQRMTSLSVHDGSSTSSSGSRLPPSSRSGASNGSGANNSRGEEAGTPVCRREPLSTSLSHSLRRGGATSGTQDLQRRGVSKASSPPEPQREEAGAARPQDRRPSSLTARRTSSATSAGLPPSPSAAAGSSSSSATRSSGTPSGSSSRGYASLATPARGTGEYPTGSSSGWVPTWGQTLIDLGLVRAPGQHQLPPASCRATTRESSTAAEEPPRRGCLSARRPPTISEATLADGGSATGSAGAGASSPSTTTVSQREGGAADASVSWTVREEQRTPLTPSTAVEPPSPQHRSLSGVGSSSSVAYSQSSQRYNGRRALYSSSSSSGSSSSSSSSSSPYLERAVVRSRYAAPTEASEARRQAISAYQLQSGVWSRDPSSSSVHRQRTAADTSFASSESPLLLRSTSPVPVSPLVLDYSGSSSSSSGRSSSVSATAASPPTLRRSVAAAGGWSLESHASPQHGYQQQQPQSSLEYYYTTAAGGGGGGGGYPAGYSSTQLMQQQHHMRRQTMNAAFPSSFSAGSRQSAGTRTGGRESPGGVFAAAGASVVSPSHFGAGTGGRASLPPSPLVYSNARLAAQGRGVAACLIDPSIGAAASSSSSSSRSHYAVPSSALPAGVYSPSSTHYQQQPTQPSRRYSASHPLGSSRSSSSSSISVSSSNSAATSNLPRAHTSCLSRGARRSVGGILQHQHVYDRGSTGGRFYLERSDGIPWAHVTRVAAHYPGRFSFREESVSRGAETYYQRMQQDEERRREDMLQVLIDLLPTSQFNSRRSATLSEEAKKCSICFEDYEHDDEQRRLPCTHVFHKNCIDIWLRRSLVCPMCKHDLRSAF